MYCCTIDLESCIEHLKGGKKFNTTIAAYFALLILVFCASFHECKETLYDVSRILTRIMREVESTAQPVTRPKSFSNLKRRDLNPHSWACEALAHDR